MTYPEEVHHETSATCVGRSRTPSRAAARTRGFVPGGRRGLRRRDSELERRPCCGEAAVLEARTVPRRLPGPHALPVRARRGRRELLQRSLCVGVAAVRDG